MSLVPKLGDARKSPAPLAVDLVASPNCGICDTQVEQSGPETAGSGAFLQDPVAGIIDLGTTGKELLVKPTRIVTNISR